MPKYKVTYSYTETDSFEGEHVVIAANEDEAANNAIVALADVDNLTIEAVEELPDDPEATPTTEPTDG